MMLCDPSMPPLVRIPNCTIVFFNRVGRATAGVLPLLREMRLSVLRGMPGMAHEYLVQKWSDGKGGTWQRVSADNELDAAQRIIGIKLRTIGKLGELRARVRVVGNLSKETAFYAAP
jgi:hypothetical protein